MRNLTVDGVILKRRNIGEADRILTVFTRQLGKITIKAGGVRKIQSRRASHIELLNLATLGLYKGKGMPVLTEAVALENFSPIKDDLTKVGFAYHICELVDGLCPENQESEAIFVLLTDMLQKLSTQNEVASVIHDFEIQLLTILGYWPVSQSTTNLNTAFLIENILERKLKSRQMLSKFL